MRVYHSQYYWPLNLVFVDRCVTKCEEDQTTNTVAIADDGYFGHTHRQTYIQVTLYVSNAKHCIGQTVSNQLIRRGH